LSSPTPRRQDPDELIAKAAEAEIEEYVSEEPDLGMNLDEHRLREAIEPNLNESLGENRLRYELYELRRQHEEAKEIHALRLRYVNRIFTLVVGWLSGVGVAILWTGFGGVNDRVFYLSDKVLIAFISSTTINVIGLFVVAAKWMYPNSSVQAAKTPDPERRQFTISFEPKKDP
jgi:hypothetical protein